MSSARDSDWPNWPLDESNVRMRENGKLPAWIQTMSTRRTQCCFDSGINASINASINVCHGAAT